MSEIMTGFGEEISATFQLQNVLLAYETDLGTRVQTDT
jgi:hypothetical protein